MQKKLPDAVAFLPSVERNASYSGSWPVSHFKRLGGLVSSGTGEVEVELAFSRESSIARLDGRITAQVEQVCQRCLHPFSQRIESEFHLALVESEDEIATLPESLDPFLVTGEEQSLAEVVEDELILSLPLVPRHDYACLESGDGIEGNDMSGSDTYRPFAALKDLLKP